MQETKILHTLQNRSEANKMIVHDIYIRKSTLTVVASVSTSTFSPSAKSCPTVRASSLPQCKAEQNPNWKEYNGTQNTKTGEGVLQHANPAKRENSNSQGRSASLPSSHHSVLWQSRETTPFYRASTRFGVCSWFLLLKTDVPLQL